MSNKTGERSTQNRTIFDYRPLSASEMELTESGNYSLYVAERVAVDTDEIHIFQVNEEVDGYSPVYGVLKSVTGDPDHPVSEICFQRGTDNRLILQIEETISAGAWNPVRDVADRLISEI